MPIRIGGGTRLKIVESLAMGTPVVSTTMGAQGLDLRHGHDALLADTEFDFIEETLRCLRDTELRQKLVREGQTTVAEQLSWEGLGARLRKIYADRFGRNTIADATHRAKRTGPRLSKIICDVNYFHITGPDFLQTGPHL